MGNGGSGSQRDLSDISTRSAGGSQRTGSALGITRGVDGLTFHATAGSNAKGGQMPRLFTVGANGHPIRGHDGSKSGWDGGGCERDQTGVKRLHDL